MALMEGFDVRAGAGTTAEAFADLRAGLTRHPIWRELVRRDLLSRTKGANLGTLWLIIAQAIAIGGMGFVYAQLFGMELTTYLPYLATGLITWGFIIALINEAGDIYTYSKGYLTQVRLPLSLFAFRYVARNVVLFLYRSVIIAAVLVACGVGLHLSAPLALLGVAAIAVCGFFFGSAIGMVTAHYRDVGQLVNSLSVFLFFITPVFWQADRLGAHRWVADYNPLYHFLTLVRAPLLGLPVGAWSYLMVAGTILAVFALWVFTFRKFGRDVIYCL